MTCTDADRGTFAAHREPTRTTSDGSPRVALAHRTLLVLLVVASTLLPASAFAISRNSVLSRAQSWVDSPVGYSQSSYHKGYRTDCSGYVSMCWGTGTSWSTRSFYRVTHSIKSRELQPGDAMLKKGYHIRLFYGWLDAQHTQYVAYEAGSVVAICRIHLLAEDMSFGYVPTRYDRISDSAPSRNLLRNGTFNVWARTGYSRTDQPIWWQVSGSPGQTLAVRRKDAYRGARNSLQLRNPTTDPNSYTETSQETSIAPGVAYRLAAWARTTTASSPTVDMQVAYLDAAGNPLSDARVQAADIGPSAFTPVSTALMAPPAAARARVTFRLAGGTSLGATGTSVLLDDVSLQRPQATIGISQGGASTHLREGVALTGSIKPTTAVGQTVTILMKRPGQDWEERTGTISRAGPTAAKWRCEFRFKSGGSAGTYYFKAKVPESPWYLGAESRVLSVPLQ